MKKISGVTVVIPTLPTRKKLLDRALLSVRRQNLQPFNVIVCADQDHEGAAITRNRGLSLVNTEFVAFLDDDDQMYDYHLDRLMWVQENTRADLTYSWFDLYIHDKLSNDKDPLAVAGMSPFGRPFDEVAKQHILTVGNFVPVTVLARTELLQDVGGFEPHPAATDAATCEDWWLWAKLLQAGAKFHHLPERTWRWNHHGLNTGGQAW